MWAAGQPHHGDTTTLVTDWQRSQRTDHLTEASTRRHALRTEGSAAAHDYNVSAAGVVVSHSVYHAPCNVSKPPAWSATATGFATVHIRKRPFVPRSPLALSFCWEQRDELSAQPGGRSGAAGVASQPPPPPPQRQRRIAATNIASGLSRGGYEEAAVKAKRHADRASGGAAVAGQSE